MGRSKSPSVRISFISRPWLIISFVIVTIIALFVGFSFGSQIKAPESDAIIQAQENIPVSVKSELRNIDQGVLLQGAVHPGQTWDMTSIQIAEANKMVVTSANVNAGDILQTGQLLGSVSGIPQILFPTSVPFYRDLKLGDQGEDVSAIQETLRSLGYIISNSDKVDQSLLNAINYLYLNVGLNPPPSDKNSIIKWSHFVSIPNNTGIVKNISAVGTSLSAEVPFMTVQLSDKTVSARATISQAEKLSLGLEVIVADSAGKETKGNISSIGPFMPSDPNLALPGGKDIGVDFTHEDALQLEDNQRMTIRSLGTNKQALAVPTVAIKHDGQGTYVVRVNTPDQNKPEVGLDIRVNVIQQIDGWSVLDGSSAVKEGEALLVQ